VSRLFAWFGWTIHLFSMSVSSRSGMYRMSAARVKRPVGRFERGAAEFVPTHVSRSPD
jgi:hypothetical protein